MNKLFTSALVLILASCGATNESAREAIAQRVCTLAERCNDFGSGKSYADKNACLVKQRSIQIDVLPSALCDQKLNASNYELCLKAIDAAGCSPLEFIPIGIKCSSVQVCK
jgi:hypothetical protein